MKGQKLFYIEHMRENHTFCRGSSLCGIQAKRDFTRASEDHLCCDSLWPHFEQAINNKLHVQIRNVVLYDFLDYWILVTVIRQTALCNQSFISLKYALHLLRLCHRVSLPPPISLVLYPCDGFHWFPSSAPPLGSLPVSPPLPPPDLQMASISHVQRTKFTFANHLPTWHR